MAKLFANSEDPDQTPHSTASDLGLHCLPISLLRISRLQWVNPNSADPDQVLHSAALSDLGLQCFPITLLGVSCLK